MARASWNKREIQRIIAELNEKAVVSPAKELPPRKKPLGRPTKQPETYARVVGYMRTITGARMACQNLGCSNRLRVNPTSICCCQACETELREFLAAALAVLDGEMDVEDYPLWMRAKSKGRRNVAREIQQMTDALHPVLPEIPLRGRKKKDGNKARRQSQGSDRGVGDRTVRFVR